MGKQHFIDEPLQALEIGDPCLEEIVEVTGHGMGLEDGESLPHEVGEALGVALGMAVKLDMDESGERKAEGSGIELGAISLMSPARSRA